MALIDQTTSGHRPLPEINCRPLLYIDCQEIFTQVIQVVQSNQPEHRATGTDDDSGGAEKNSCGGLWQVGRQEFIRAGVSV